MSQPEPKARYVRFDGSNDLLWERLDRAQMQGAGVFLTADQVRDLLRDNARLVEAKNDIVRRFALLGAEQIRRLEEERDAKFAAGLESRLADV